VNLEKRANEDGMSKKENPSNPDHYFYVNGIVYGIVYGIV
jgi:hypothetical protein